MLAGVVSRADGEALAEIQRLSYARASDALRRSWPEEQALDAAALAAFLGRKRYGVLATSRPDGRPHAAPVAYAVADGAFWVATVAGLRLRNLRSTPWASLVVMEGELDQDDAGPGTAHVAVTAEGRVRLHEDDAFAAAFARLRAQWVERHGHEPDWAAALAELRPERIFSHAAR